MNEQYPNQYPNQNTGAPQYPPQGTGVNQYPNQYSGGAQNQNGYYVPAGGQPYPPQPPVKKKGKAGKIIGIVIGAIALVLVVVVVIGIVASPSLDFGEVDGNTYKNESIGIKFTAPDGFTFKKADKNYLTENMDSDNYSADDIKTDDEKDLPYVYLRDDDNNKTTIKEYYEVYGDYSDDSTGLSSHVCIEYLDGNSEDSINDFSESSLLEHMGEYNDDNLKTFEEEGFTSSKGDIKDKKIGSKTFRCQEFTYTIDSYGYKIEMVVEAGYYKSGDDAIAFEIVTVTNDLYTSAGYSMDDLLDCFGEID